MVFKMRTEDHDSATGTCDKNKTVRRECGSTAHDIDFLSTSLVSLVDIDRCTFCIY